MEAICIDATNSDVLKEGDQYFVFPHGISSFYISKFDNVKSHTGAFQRGRFELIKKQEIIDETEAEQIVQEEKFDDYTQMEIFEFLNEGYGDTGIEIVIPENVLSPLENTAGLKTKKFREDQQRWRKYVKAVEEYHRCSFFEARELVFKHRKSQEPIRVLSDLEYKNRQDFSCTQ
ncbi:hypothetical protein ACDX78_10370 [Virgibacillus oceani]